ncbi:cytochrome c oxidase subunit 1 [Catalinimonas alkaloidigena]|uniref:cytochrome c oxidase subunit I n=1 Tax=Catalinimonas alkaloidigena TaxID=1075417 RepID=UPI00240692B7|nr:cbb3-type cytochrome c oxidase subunit I [Catalinimonas alkaloidigena]MDF9797093.1 cytochrome c oxidase subunit 1 [Catalinimonas alkaloidigena]
MNSETEGGTEFEEVSFLHGKDHGSKFLVFIFTYVFSTDHKTIAKQYLFTAIFWALLGSLLSVVFRIQLGFPELDLSWLQPVLGNRLSNGRLDPEFYLSLVTLHGTIMMFFVLTGGFLGTMGNLLIPLQIGARDMASGFMNMLSYWLFFISGLIMFCSFFVESGAASAGWTAYPPLSALKDASAGSGAGMSLWILSMVIFIISNLLTSINFIATTVNLRTLGMSFRRLPLTIWAFLFTTILSLLSFPVLFVALLLLFFDRGMGTSFYLNDIFIDGAPLPNSGGSVLLYQHLFWFLGHPEVYIAIFPAFGITSDVIATNARKPIFGYPAMVASIFAIMILSFLVWAHHMFVSGMSPFLGSVFSLTSFIIAVPSAIKVFNWITTLWKGNIHFSAAMLFAIGMVSFFITGGLTGLFVANPSIDIEVHDTYFVVAHFHLVMGSAAFFGFLCGVYHWFPKMFGRMMNRTMSYLHFWLTFIGVYLIFFPMHFLGMSGFPRRYYSFTYFDTFDTYMDLNAFISIAAFITFAGQGIFLLNFFYAIFFGKKAPENPWRATTLEWTTPVKVKAGNWPGAVPVVYRWAYDYSVPGAENDFIPQHVSDKKLLEKKLTNES